MCAGRAEIWYVGSLRAPQKESATLVPRVSIVLHPRGRPTDRRPRRGRRHGYVKRRMAPAVELLVPQRGARRGRVAKLIPRGSSGDRSTGPEGRGGDRDLADRVAWVRSSRRLRQPVGPARTICTPWFRGHSCTGLEVSGGGRGAPVVRADRGSLRAAGPPSSGAASVAAHPCADRPEAAAVRCERSAWAVPRRRLQLLGRGGRARPKLACTHRTWGYAIGLAAPGDGRDTCFVRASSAAFCVRRRRRGASAPRRGPARCARCR